MSVLSSYPSRFQSFYCRARNRMVVGCPLSVGPEGCPVRRDCPATYAPPPEPQRSSPPTVSPDPS